MFDMQEMTIPGPGTFVFSAVKPDDLGATEYTLVTIVMDKTGSVDPFADDLMKMLRTIVDACKKSPRAENLMIRLILFDTQIKEIHGFKTLAEIDPNDYDPIRPSGMTALFDATYSAAGATLQYGNTLAGQDFDVNAAMYIITDGMDNDSTMTPGEIAKKIQAARTGEEIESVVSILVGLHDPNLSWEADTRAALERFQKEAEIDQFVDVGEATPGKLAKLANFVSESISSQSQALGSGGPSSIMTF